MTELFWSGFKLMAEVNSVYIPVLVIVLFAKKVLSRP
jgi:hypothetical protein